jgi:hypothetical protein
MALDNKKNFCNWGQQWNPPSLLFNTYCTLFPLGAKWPKLEKTPPFHLLPKLRINEVTVNVPHMDLWHVHGQPFQQRRKTTIDTQFIAIQKTEIYSFVCILLTNVGAKGLGVT